MQGLEFFVSISDFCYVSRREPGMYMEMSKPCKCQGCWPMRGTVLRLGASHLSRLQSAEKHDDTMSGSEACRADTCKMNLLQGNNNGYNHFNLNYYWISA